MRSALAIVLAACGATPTPPRAAPVATGPDCTQVAAAAVAALQAMIPDAQRPDVRALVAAHCADDAWSLDARQCVVAATTHEAAHACGERKLTGEQHERLGKALSAFIKPPGPAFSITAIEPARGDADGGTYARLTGKHLLVENATAKVFFGAKQGEVIRFASATEAIVQAPGGKDGETVDVRLAFEPGGEVTLPHAFTFVTKIEPAIDTPTPAGSQAEIAHTLDLQGKTAMFGGDFARASAKFREVVARDPQPGYFFDLCTSLEQEGKFGEALTACDAVRTNKPSAMLDQKALQLIEKIKDEAKRQNVKLH